MLSKFNRFLVVSICRFSSKASKKEKNLQGQLAASLSDFDQKMKDKYLNQKNKENQNLDIDQIKQKITQEYETEADRMFNEDSILKRLRSGILNEPENNKTQQQKVKSSQPLEDYFSNITHEEYLKRAKDLFQDIKSNKIPDSAKANSISNDYGNYHSFNNNYAYINSKKQEWENLSDYAYRGSNIARFVQNFDKNMYEKQQMDEQIEEQKKLHPGSTTDDILELYKKRDQAYNVKFNKWKPSLDVGDKSLNEEMLTYKKIYRCSPICRDEIYRLYLKGWSVKDLSNRFGMIPERVKAIIWMRQKFYYEILPTQDLATVRMAYDRELEFNKEHPWRDYGIDLEELMKRDQGIMVPSFSKQRDVDVKATETLDERTKQIIEKKKIKKSDKIIEGFIGKYNKGYFVKSWNVTRGKGSDRINKMFQKIIYNSHQPDRLPIKVQKKLKMGPRIASMGYGYK